MIRVAQAAPDLFPQGDMAAAFIARPEGQPLTQAEQKALALAAASSVCDPEIPALSIADLGILHDVAVGEDGAVSIKILPTYSGCPAMSVIAIDLEIALAKAGFKSVSVVLTQTPAWSTDMMSDSGREKLRAIGIAPPERGSGKRALFAKPDVSCPRCHSGETERITEFGSTSCKALWRCKNCLEPFDYFKCI